MKAGRYEGHLNVEDESKEYAEAARKDLDDE